MPQRRSSSPRAELDDLSRRQADVADVCARIFKALDALLQKEGIHELNLEQMIALGISRVFDEPPYPKAVGPLEEGDTDQILRGLQNPKIVGPSALREPSRLEMSGGNRQAK